MLAAALALAAASASAAPIVVGLNGAAGYCAGSSIVILKRQGGEARFPVKNCDDVLRRPTRAAMAPSTVLLAPSAPDGLLLGAGGVQAPAFIGSRR